MVEADRRGYFTRVPKAVILDAVGEYAPESVNRLAKLKKADIVREAERLAYLVVNAHAVHGYGM